MCDLLHVIVVDVYATSDVRMLMSGQEEVLKGHYHMNDLPHRQTFAIWLTVKFVWWVFLMGVPKNRTSSCDLMYL